MPNAAIARQTPDHQINFDFKQHDSRIRELIAIQAQTKRQKRKIVLNTNAKNSVA